MYSTNSQGLKNPVQKGNKNNIIDNEKCLNIGWPISHDMVLKVNN